MCLLATPPVQLLVNAMAAQRAAVRFVHAIQLSLQDCEALLVATREFGSRSSRSSAITSFQSLLIRLCLLRTVYK